MIDYEKLCQNFNEFRLENLNKIFNTRSEMQSAIRKLGINKLIFGIMCKNHVFDTRRNGNQMQYAFKRIPLYKNDLKRIYVEYNSSKVSKKNIKEENSKVLNEENAIKLLKSLGYKIQRIEGLNEKLLKIDHPDIYEKYIIIKDI